MNISLIQGGLGPTAPTGAGRSGRIDAAAPAAARGGIASTAHAPASAARRADFATRQEQLNRQATYAQRSIAFLDDAAKNLQELKSSLSGSVARRASATHALEISLARAQSHWQQRHAATGGALGPDLAFHDDGGARQAFRIQALDLPALHEGQPETLTVYPRGVGKPASVLLIDGQHRSEREWARRVDHALAAGGIGTSLSHDRQLDFHTREERWPELRERLAIQGDGQRFPAGRPGHAIAAALPAAIDPSRWTIGSASEQRETLRHVVRAAEHIQATREQLQRNLQDCGATLRVETQRMLASGDAAATAAMLAETLGSSGAFQRFVTIGAALRGLSEQRVRAVSA